MARSQADQLYDVISATLACIDEHGVDAVRLREIAERASVSKGWILSLFPSRTALIAASVCGRFIGDIARSLDLASHVARSADDADAFLGIVLAHRRRGEHVLDREHVWQFLEVLVWSFSDADVAGEVHRAHREIVDSFERLTIVFDDRGWLRAEVGPLSMAILLMASALARMFADSEPTEDRPEDSLLPATLTSLLHHGADVEHGASAGSPSTERPSDVAAPTVDEPESITRQRILAAAARELIEHGPLDFRIQVVMEEAEVSSSVLYRHFANRDEVMGRAALRLTPENRRALRSMISQGLPGVSDPAFAGRDVVVTALRSVIDVVRTSGSDQLRVALTSLVAGRRFDSVEQFALRKQEYFGAAAQLFTVQSGVLGAFDPQSYAPIGPLGFFMMVVVVNHPDALDIDDTLAPAFLRVVETMLSLEF